MPHYGMFLCEIGSTKGTKFTTQACQNSNSLYNSYLKPPLLTSHYHTPINANSLEQLQWQAHRLRRLSWLILDVSLTGFRIMWREHLHSSSEIN